MIDATLVTLAVLAVLPSACWPVAGSQILARDLAQANALFSTLDPDAAFGFAPLPGAKRLLLGRELAAFVRRQGTAIVNEPLADLCVERQAAPLRAADVSAALFEAAGIPDVRVELLDYSRQSVPGGRLEFRWNMLPAASGPDIAVIWRGQLHYDAQNSLAVWAKVRISVERPVVIATTDIAPGPPIEQRQIQLLRMRVFPSRNGFLETPDAALGKAVSRMIRAGQPLPISVLREPDDVAVGEKVQVRVVDGSAYVSFEAKALSGGRKGAAVSLRNPSSGRIFVGTVTDKGVVVVRSGGPD